MARIGEEIGNELEEHERREKGPPTPVPDKLREKLSAQTCYVSQWAAAENHGPNSMAHHHRSKYKALGSFQDRLKVVRDANLFVDERHLPPTLKNIIEMQRRIAYSVHSLKYARNSDAERAPGRWVTEAKQEQIKPFGGRANAFLDHFMKNYEPEAKSIAKVDLALIAHCFGLPAELWEIEDNKLFEYWVKIAAQGTDLIKFGGPAIADNSLRVEDLGPDPILQPVAPAVARKPRAVAANLYPPIPARKFLRFVIDLPEEFSSAQAMLFEDDGANIALISTKKATDESLIYSGGVFETPRRRKLSDQLPTDELERERRVGAFSWNPCPHTEFVTLIVANDAKLRLDQLDFYKSDDAIQVLDWEHIINLRRELFALPPVQWIMLKKEVAVA